MMEMIAAEMQPAEMKHKAISNCKIKEKKKTMLCRSSLHNFSFVMSYFYVEESLFFIWFALQGDQGQNQNSAATAPSLDKNHFSLARRNSSVLSIIIHIRRKQFVFFFFLTEPGFNLNYCIV